MPSYARAEGILIESIGHLWAAFSPANGETALINDESAAVLELLGFGPGDTAAISTTLATDSGLAVEVLAKAVEACWPRLVDAGLVRELRADHTGPQ